MDKCLQNSAIDGNLCVLVLGGKNIAKSAQAGHGNDEILVTHKRN